LRKDGAVGLVAPKMRLGPNRFQFCIDRTANTSKINTGTRFAPADFGTVVPHTADTFGDIDQRVLGGGEGIQHQQMVAQIFSNTTTRTSDGQFQGF